MVLDAGVGGIIFPSVNSCKEAELAVARLGVLAGSRKRFDKAREQAQRTIAEIIHNFDPWVDPQVMPAQVEAHFEKMRTEASKQYPRLF